MPSATVIPLQDRLLNTRVPLTTQTFSPDVFTLADMVKLAPTVLVPLAGETYKELPSAIATAAEHSMTKEIKDMIFVLVFIFLFLMASGSRMAPIIH